MPLNRNKTDRFMLIEALPLLHLAARRYVGLFKKSLLLVPIFGTFVKNQLL